MGSPQSPPQPYVSEDAVNRAFEGNGNGYMNGHTQQTQGNGDYYEDSDDEDYEDEDDVFRPRAALVTDYR